MPTYDLKLLEEVDSAMISWITHQKQRQQKPKIDKLNYIKILNICAEKKKNSQVKMQFME
jgi:succinate dehydrogenase flavin-adding protein (antitoxin of CptAB toxin-antitoxin module)